MRISFFLEKYIKIYKFFIDFSPAIDTHTIVISAIVAEHYDIIYWDSQVYIHKISAAQWMESGLNFIEVR